MASVHVTVTIHPGLCHILFRRIVERLDWPACRQYRRSLRRMMGKCECFDAVTAKDGAIEMFPTTKMWDLAHAVGIELHDLIDDE